MSLSTTVVGFRPADEKFKKMKAILDSCLAADVSPPKKVKDFFGDMCEDCAVDSEGVKVDLTCSENQPGVTKWKDDYSEGYQVDLRELDSTIKIIRFYNSW
jgi:hypothetical protein